MSDQQYGAPLNFTVSYHGRYNTGITCAGTAWAKAYLKDTNSDPPPSRGQEKK